MNALVIAAKRVVRLREELAAAEARLRDLAAAPTQAATPTPAARKTATRKPLRYKRGWAGTAAGTRTAAIVAFLAEHPDSRSREVQAVVGGHRAAVASQLADLVRSSVLVRSGVCRHYTYRLVNGAEVQS